MSVAESVVLPLQIRDTQVCGAVGMLAARIYTAGAASEKRDGLIVFFHGGGFVGGDGAGAVNEPDVIMAVDRNARDIAENPVVGEPGECGIRLESGGLAAGRVLRD